MFNCCTIAEAWFEHLQNITLRVDDSTTMTIHERAAMLMEPFDDNDEQMLDETNLSLSTPTAADDREQSDIIKVKNVCKCR
jgi:hypothetical protein